MADIVGQVHAGEGCLLVERVHLAIEVVLDPTYVDDAEGLRRAARPGLLLRMATCRVFGGKGLDEGALGRDGITCLVVDVLPPLDEVGARAEIDPDRPPVIYAHVLGLQVLWQRCLMLQGGVRASS